MEHEKEPKPDGRKGFPVHSGEADPVFEDRYYSVALEAHAGLRIRNTRRDGGEVRDWTEREERMELKIDRPFSCRVRQWKFGDENAPKLRFLMISGICHSCNFFNPLVKCMSLDDTFTGFRTEVYALDIPGHGASECPPNIKFGMLRLEDYVDAIEQLMKKLKTEEGVEAFDYVVAHSMGGMLAMLLEESLSAAGAPGLLKEYLTRGIVLLASALPEQIDWSFGEGRVSEYGIPGHMLRALLPFVTFSPRYALHGRISNEDFVPQFFGVVEKGRERDRTKAVSVVPGAPRGDMVSVMNSPEAYVALSELAGIDLESGGVLKRPDIREGLFSEYTLGISGYIRDFLFRPEEELALLEYLSLNRSRIFKKIDHEYAVHDDAYSFPCASFQLLAEVVALSKA